MVSGGVDSTVCAALLHKALNTNEHLTSNGHHGDESSTSNEQSDDADDVSRPKELERFMQFPSLSFVYVVACSDSGMSDENSEDHVTQRVIAVHVDNGFMRKNESVAVERSLRSIGLRPIGTRIYAKMLFKFLLQSTAAPPSFSPLRHVLCDDAKTSGRIRRVHCVRRLSRKRSAKS